MNGRGPSGSIEFVVVLFLNYWYLLSGAPLWDHWDRSTSYVCFDALIKLLRMSSAIYHSFGIHAVNQSFGIFGLTYISVSLRLVGAPFTTKTMQRLPPHMHPSTIHAHVCSVTTMPYNKHSSCQDISCFLRG